MEYPGLSQIKQEQQNEEEIVSYAPYSYSVDSKLTERVSEMSIGQTISLSTPPVISYTPMTSITTNTTMPSILNNMVSTNKTKLSNNNNNNNTTENAPKIPVPMKRRAKKPIEKEINEIKHGVKSVGDEIKKGKNMIEKERVKMLNLKRKHNTTFTVTEKLSVLSKKIEAIGDNIAVSSNTISNNVKKVESGQDSTTTSNLKEQRKIKTVAREMLSVIDSINSQMESLKSTLDLLDKKNQQLETQIDKIKEGLLKDSFKMARRLSVLCSNQPNSVTLNENKRFPRVFNYRDENLTPEEDNQLFL